MDVIIKSRKKLVFGFAENYEIPMSLKLFCRETFDIFHMIV